MPGLAQLWLTEKETARLQSWGDVVRRDLTLDWEPEDQQLLEKIELSHREVACRVPER